MFRVGQRLVVSLIFVAAIGSESRAWAQGQGVAAQIAALQTQVSTLSNRVTALENAIGAANVWQNAVVEGAVPRNDATNIGDWTHSTLASLSLPAGSYLLQAKTSLQDPDISASLFHCALFRSSSPSYIDNAIDYSVQNEPTILKVVGVVTLPSAETVSFQCGASGPASQPGTAVSYQSKLVAIQANVR